MARETAFRHEVLLYAGGDHGFLQGALAPVQRALADDAGVLVAVCDERANTFRQALGEDAQRVCFTDAHELGRNPARVFAVWQDFARENAQGGRSSAVGISEPVWPGRSPAELSECERQEALVNFAFGGGPGWRLVCAYDVDGLDAHTIAAAKRAHPLLAEDGASHANATYACAHDVPGPFAGSLPIPQGAVEETAFAPDTLAQLRHTVAAWSAAEGLGAAGVEELVLAVDELAVNSVRHGGGRGTLRFWREAEELLCEVRDTGHIEAPLTGRLRPAPDACSGRGVWLVNQLCDLVQIRSAPAGSVVRVHKRLDALEDHSQREE